MRCASYVKYASCIPEKEIPSDIIRQQNDRIRKYIKSKGWELTEKYTERKKDTEAEEVFQTLREDGISRKFDMVVVDSIFRCGRNVSFAEDVLLKTFYPAGIHFAVVEDDFCSMYLSAGDVAAEATPALLEKHGIDGIDFSVRGFDPRPTSDWEKLELDEPVATPPARSLKIKLVELLYALNILKFNKK